MPKIRLTHRGISSLSAGRWMTDYWDEHLPGFGVRVSPSGRKTYGIRYKMDGQRKRMVIGVYPILSLADARDKARKVLYSIARGEDPQLVEAPSGPTFGELVEIYIERHAKVKKRSWREDQRILDRNVLPYWSDRAITNIRRKDVVQVLDVIVERGALIMANRTKALISKVFNFGIGRALVEHNPAMGVPMPGKPNRRDRVLTEDEIRILWDAFGNEGSLLGAHFQMRLLTAQRGNEVLKMRWDQINDGWWTIPAETAKNGLAHEVPLSDPVKDLLAQIHRQTGDSDWVFESSKKPNTPMGYVQKAAVRMVHRSGVDFVPHDLRRTAATFMTRMGTPRLVVSKILNHVEQSVTAIYDRYDYEVEKQEALERWGSRVEEIVS